MIKKMQQYPYEKKRMIAIFTALLCVAVYALLILVYLRFNSVSEALGEGGSNTYTADASSSQSVNPLRMVSDAFINVFSETIPRDGAPVVNNEPNSEQGGLKYVPSSDAPNDQ